RRAGRPSLRGKPATAAQSRALRERPGKRRVFLPEREDRPRVKGPEVYERLPGGGASKGKAGPLGHQGASEGRGAGRGRCVQVAREDRAGEPVARPLVDEVERVLVAGVVVDERGHYRPEQLLLHRAEVRVGGLDHGRLDEPAVTVVIAAARDDRRLPVGRL